MNDKLINNYKIKSQNLPIKDISLEKREVAFYLSHFGNIDSDNDMIVRGAFKKSLQERGVDSTTNRKIAYLRYHDWEKPIGKFTRLEEDDFGLFAVGKLGTSRLGEDALADYDEGVIREHSIGFKYIQDKVKWIPDETMESKGYYMITELALWEGSAVTFGANEMTPVLQVSKGQNKIDLINNISKEIDLITKSLINGKGSDERLYELEMKSKFLNSQLLELATINISNTKSEPIIDKKGYDWGIVFNGIK